MSIRAIGLAVAVVFAMACRTSGSQASGASGTAQAPSADTHGASGTAQAPSSSDQGTASAQGTASSSDASGSTASGEVSSSPSPSDASGSTASGEVSSSAPSDVSGSAASGAAGSSASGAQETTGGLDPLVEPGPAIKGHASDQVVSGKIEEVSGSSVTISSHVGERKVLEIAPETDITIDGMEASAADLEEGQPVRASYNQAEGEDVAVAIEAGKEPSSTEPKELGATPGSSPSGESSVSGSAGTASGSGSASGTGSAAPGSSSGAGSSGTSAEPAAPTGGAGR